MLRSGSFLTPFAVYVATSCLRSALEPQGTCFGTKATTDSEHEEFERETTAGRLRVPSTPLLNLRLEVISLKFREQRNQGRADTGKSADR